MSGTCFSTSARDCTRVQEFILGETANAAWVAVYRVSNSHYGNLKFLWSRKGNEVKFN